MIHTAIFQHKDDVRYRVMGSEAVVIRQNDAEVLALNELGARVLELVDARTSVGELIDRLETEYEVARQTLELDVSDFLSELTRLGVVEEVSRESMSSAPKDD